MKSRVLAVAAVLALSLSACGSAEDAGGDEDNDRPTASATTESAATEATPTADATADATDAATGDLTPPGTELAVGEWATVPFTYGTDKEGVLKVRVTAVDTGSQADFAAFDKSTQSKLKGFTPKYVRIEATQVSGGNLEYASIATNFDPITSSGEEAQSLAAIGTFEPCKGGSFPAGFGPGSPAATSCVIGLVAQGGDDVVGGAYSLRDSDYDSYDGEPVLWK